MSFETTPLGGTVASPNLAEVSLGGVKALGYNIFCALASAATRRPRGLTFGPWIEGAAPESGNQVAVRVAVE
jgi:hypothetical protein